VLSNTTDVTAAPSGAAFPGICSPWANLKTPGLSAAGTSHVRMPNSVPAAKGTDAGLGAFWQIPAMTTMHLTATATGLPTAIQNRKHTVYKTRVNAGGDGASGPHPEREPA
jgi:hypothetical protein